jgi:GT2 family glycosyltransferase
MSASDQAIAANSDGDAGSRHSVSTSDAAEAGVSILLCTRNGASRVAQTLDHLRRQRDVERIKWEIVLVDNASTDGTAERARGCWRTDNAVPMRIISERQPGHSFARTTGIDAARYEYVSVVDDDNLVCERWVARVVEVMDAHPEVGACGGYSEAIFEGPVPPWFDRYSQFHAIGPQPSRPGTLVEDLWFAGTTIRARAWREMRRAGFRFITTAAGEDTEFSIALRLAGWKLALDEELRFRHVMPANRITWHNFCTAQRSRVADYVAIDPYHFALDQTHGRIARSWCYQFAAILTAYLRNLMVRPRKAIWPYAPEFEGDDDVLRIGGYRGRMAGLLKHRRHYAANVRAIANAAWRDTGPAARA